MSELQMALIAAGGVLVAGVWGYNKWQERKHRQLAEKIFRGGQADVLLADARPGESAAPAAGRQEPLIDPLAGESAALPEVPAESAAGPATPPLPAELADDLVDCLVRIECVEAVPAPGLWAGQSRWAGQVGKALSWLAYDETANAWRRLDAHDAGRYRTLVAALQLADRRGAVSDAELTAFLDGVRDAARQCAGVAELPPRDEVLMHARGLDEFCAQVDLQLGVNIVAPPAASFAGTKLRGLAEAAGLVLMGDGAYHALDEAGETRYTLGNIGAELFEVEAMKSLATQGITLSLDVPRAADGPAAFDAMLAVARQLATALGGALVDAQGTPLAEAMIDAIRAKVDELQQRMAGEQIVAGSIRARRLFS